MKIEELDANYGTVSVHKYGFFLCLKGTARILLGKEIYELSPYSLCIYTPNTFFQILERSSDLQGILEEDAVDAYYPAVSIIDIRKRLQIRHSPCIMLNSEQTHSIVRLMNLLNSEKEYIEENLIHTRLLQNLRYALCLKILELYFLNKPVKAMELNREDTVLNQFLISVYSHCHRQRTVQYYAAEQNLSPYYFSSIVKSRSGHTALKWIEIVTQTFARQYLECTDMSIKQISDRLNFSDQSTFCRWFRKHKGCTPMEFRKNRKKIKTPLK